MPSMAAHKLWTSRILIIGGLALLSACSTAADRQEVLLSGDEPVPKDAKYPDFSKPLVSAMDQMTDEDAKKQEAQLAALAGRRKSGTISEAEYWRQVNAMKKLGATVPTKPANN